MADKVALCAARISGYRERVAGAVGLAVSELIGSSRVLAPRVAIDLEGVIVTHAPLDIVPRLAHPGFAAVHDFSDVSDQQLVAVEQQERRDHPVHHDVWIVGLQLSAPRDCAMKCALSQRLGH